MWNYALLSCTEAASNRSGPRNKIVEFGMSADYAFRELSNRVQMAGWGRPIGARARSKAACGQ